MISSMEIFAFHPGLNKWVEIGNSGMFRPEMLLPMGLPGNQQNHDYFADTYGDGGSEVQLHWNFTLIMQRMSTLSPVV